jgi:hypothetical protein
MFPVILLGMMYGVEPCITTSNSTGNKPWFVSKPHLGAGIPEAYV